LIFSDLVESNAEDRDYREMGSMEKLNKILDDQLNEYNLMVSNQMHLVFFSAAIQHLTRISRILRQPRGNALLIGVGGSGRQSLTRLATFIADYDWFQIEITKSYSIADWREDLRDILRKAGIQNRPMVFLISDAQLKYESFV